MTVNKEWAGQFRAAINALRQGSQRPAATATAKSAQLGAAELPRMDGAGPVFGQKTGMAGEIRRITKRYGWHEVVPRALHLGGVSTLSALEFDDLQALYHRMVRMEECIRDGFDTQDE